MVVLKYSENKHIDDPVSVNLLLLLWSPFHLLSNVTIQTNYHSDGISNRISKGRNGVRWVGNCGCHNENVIMWRESVFLLNHVRTSAHYACVAFLKAHTAPQQFTTVMQSRAAMMWTGAWMLHQEWGLFLQYTVNVVRVTPLTYCGPSGKWNVKFPCA
jgi:hypothetical protein